MSSIMLLLKFWSLKYLSNQNKAASQQISQKRRKVFLVQRLVGAHRVAFYVLVQNPNQNFPQIETVSLKKVQKYTFSPPIAT